MTYFTSHPGDVGSIHQANLLTLLSRRLESAKAQHNQSLVAALEYEYQQLTAVATQPQTASAGGYLQQLWASFAQTLSEWNKVQIEQGFNAQGHPTWSAYNPQLGETILTESKAEMHQWIRKHYWGK
ncbi:hypothetical protein [cf. Phormidesmis sp. LEGE 11477]|uniref:hypothetical protein n=1 Tax=cf. Phormidesmis sp. LEGE 11477 TaxID=1828680 RepID=UPI00187F85DD|nr:hypothetical protein [cf. Phormidesmis sp. LEGE 11477]MBE9062558.1 hypothetical protein [cf. Phormidesmis sp. LEGE 11477]